MIKNVQSVFTSVANLRRIGKRIDQQDQQNMRARIEDVVRRIDAANARERQARLERKVVDFQKRRQAQLNEEQ